MYFWIPVALAIVLTGVAPVTTTAQTSVATYDVSWSARTFPSAHVEARLQIVGGRLMMFPGLAWAFGNERGWALNVRNLAVVDGEGDALAVQAQAAPEWSVGGGYDGPATVTYDVDFSFALRPYETGNEQIAWLQDRALFTTGFALFVHPEGDTPATVRISVPDGWTLATPWPRSEDGTYEVKDTNDLIRNVLTVGKGYHLETLSRGDMTVDIALLGQNGRAAELIRETFTDILDYYLEMLDFSSSGHFLMVLLPGPNDGEGYMTSFASSQPDVPSRGDILVWGNSLAHELFHYWNGSRISSLWEHYPERQWFSEGFTEYYANLALLHAGIIDTRRYQEILGHYLSFHRFFATSDLFRDVTMREAGQKKGLYRPGVYDSGVAVAFCLDGLIRAGTNDTRSLDDMMRLMERRYGEPSRPIVFADIVAAASEMAGADLSSFFSEHVQGRHPLPVEQCAADMGYHASVDGYHIYLDPIR